MKDMVLLPADKMEVLNFDWGAIRWFASGKLGNSAHVTFGECRIKPGLANPAHHHPNCEEVLHVLTGRILHYVEGQKPVPMGVGDTITIATNVNHYARNTGTTDAVMVITFSSADRTMVKAGPEARL